MPRYAWSDPYAPLRERLNGLADRLRARGARCAVFVDSNHHVDRDAAVRAGLAFSARNTMAIVPGEGSFVALGAIVTDAELEPAEELVPPGCGSCTLCLDACPTDALIEPGVLDATRCLSTTTQARGPVPEDHADGARGSRLRLRHLPGRVPVERRPGPAAAPTCPSTRARGSRSPTGSSCRTRSCCRGTRTSTSPSAIRATCGATRSSRSATGRPRSASSARRYADSADPLLRDAARRALTELTRTPIPSRSARASTALPKTTSWAPTPRFATTT